MCIVVFVLLCFFFFKQKTAYEMRISDWSSDVCSSDLSKGAVLLREVRGRTVLRQAQDKRKNGRGISISLPFDACEASHLGCKRRSHEHFGQDFHLVGRRDRRHAAEQLEHGQEGRRGPPRQPLFQSGSAHV